MNGHRFVSLLLLGWLAMLGSWCRAQTPINLVPNPQLSNFLNCPTTTGQTTLCVGWYQPGAGSSDYFNTCNPFGPPINFGIGGCMPHSNPGMLGFITYSGAGPTAPSSSLYEYREYVACQLTSPMIPGNLYKVSFWRQSINGLGFGYYSNNIGVFFSGTPVYQPTTGFGQSHINALPQLEETTICTDTQWVQKTYFIQAPAGSNWQYMTLGNFRNDTLTALSPSPGLSPVGYPYGGTYYFVDDFEITPAVNSLTLTATTTSITCFGHNNGSANVTVSGGNGQYQYAWSNGDTTGSVNGLAAGNYVVNVWDNNVPVAVGSLTITVPGPAAMSGTLSLAPVSVCTGDTVAISASISGGMPPYSLLWSTGAMNTPSITTVAGSLPLTYSLNTTDAIGCAQTFSIGLSPGNPQAYFTTNPLCHTSLLFGNSSTSASSYTWNYGDGVSNTQQQGTHHYANAGTYTVSLIASDAQGCADTLAQAVTVVAGANASFRDSVLACSDSVIFINSSTNSNSFSWTFGDGTTSNVQSPTHSYAGAGAQGISNTYTVGLIAYNALGCPDTLYQAVTTAPGAMANFSYSVVACSDSVLFLNTSNNSNAFLWNFGDGTSSLLQHPDHVYTNPGPSTVTYTVQLIASDAVGCRDTLRQSLTVGGLTVASFTYSALACADSVVFGNTSSNSTSFLWNFGDGGSSTLQNPSHVYINAGSPTVTLIADPGQPCSDTTQLLLPNVMGPLLADFDYTLHTDNDVYLQNTSTGGSQAYWSFGDGSADVATWHAYHSFNSVDTNSFLVCLTVVNPQHCSDVICKTITVFPDMTLYVPNAFSPNNDHINDRFQASGQGIARFKMRVFDRWGQQIFYSEDLEQGWDGSYKNEAAPVDIYIWSIEATSLLNNKTYTRTGHVNLIK